MALYELGLTDLYAVSALHGTDRRHAGRGDRVIPMTCWPGRPRARHRLRAAPTRENPR